MAANHWRPETGGLRLTMEAVAGESAAMARAWMVKVPVAINPRTNPATFEAWNARGAARVNALKTKVARALFGQRGCRAGLNPLAFAPPAIVMLIGDKDFLPGFLQRGFFATEPTALPVALARAQKWRVRSAVELLKVETVVLPKISTVGATSRGGLRTSGEWSRPGHGWSEYGRLCRPRKHHR